MNHAPACEPHRAAHLLAVAGLLHDLGKVLQPAGIELPSDNQRLESILCPSDPQTMRPTDRHVLFTSLALDRARTNFGGLDSREIFRIACYHHRPSSDRFFENLLTKADWLASGHDRRSMEGPGEPVCGVLPSLPLLEWPAPRAESQLRGYVPTTVLSLDPDRFLPGGEQTRTEYAQACAQLAETLTAGLGRDFDDPRHCVEGLLALLERVCHAVPASRSRPQAPDVNLFDHSRIVAAFAACLAVQHPEGPCDPQQIRGRYRLVSLAVGQIQDFITRAVTAVDAAQSEKGMAKRLRARSFYVSLLTWLSAVRLLDATGLPLTNLLLDAGGRATLLFPDEERCLRRLHTAIGYLREWFHCQLGGALRFDLAISAPLDDAAFSEGNFASTLRSQEQAVARARWELANPRLRTASGWAESGWIAEELTPPLDTETFQEMLRRIGQVLPRARYLSLDCPQNASGGADFEILGYRVRLHETRPEASRVFALSLSDDDPLTIPLRMTARHVPSATADDLRRLEAQSSDDDITDETGEEANAVGDPLTFVELAQLASDDQGTEIRQAMLGVLKADVDHLGALLGYGLGDRASFGRFATVSRSLDLFFKGFLTEQLRTRYPHIYTVFAGGDDLFLIGPWYDLVRLLRDLRGWFLRMTGENPNVTFSAGLVFAGPTVPVRLLAEQADEALELAKEAGRNRISVGSLTLTWDEFQRALQLHQLMCERAGTHVPEPGRLKRGIVFRCLQYARMARTPKSTFDMKWRAQLSYDLKRNYPLSRTDPELAAQQARLHQELMEIHTPAEAGVLQCASLLTLYFFRGTPR